MSFRRSVEPPLWGVLVDARRGSHNLDVASRLKSRARKPKIVAMCEARQDGRSVVLWAGRVQDGGSDKARSGEIGPEAARCVPSA
jgi:hypothetical protein